MSHPEYIYYALLVLLVMPSLLVNHMAVVVVLAWLPGQILGLAYPAMDLAPIRLVCDITALIAGKFLAHNTGNVMVAVLFFSAIIVDLMEVTHAIRPYPAWWAIFWIAVLQALFVPLGNNWRPFCKWLYRRGLTKDPNLDFHFRLPHLGVGIH